MTPAYKPWAESIETLNLVKQDINHDYQKSEWFYTYKDGTIFPFYKSDIKKIINVFKPSTFLPIFQELDIPFYEEKWLHLINQCIEKNGDFSCIFGKYLAWCKLFDIRRFGFQDSNKFFMNSYDYDNFIYTIK